MDPHVFAGTVQVGDMVQWYGTHDVRTIGDAKPRVSKLQLFPLKSLGLESCNQATLVAAGALEGDREWAILDQPATEPYDPRNADVSGTGTYVNGKKTAKIHRLGSTFHRRADAGPAVTLWERDSPDEKQRFDLFDGRETDSTTEAETQQAVHEPLNDWLSEYFGRSVSVHWDGDGHHDDRTRYGPTVISTATLREIAEWFDWSVESARRRFRANIEIDGVPPFWEDTLVADSGAVVPFQIGGVEILGVHPCQRCVVPSRDPDTGGETPEFRETFLKRRQETRPEWTASDRFDHLFRVMVNTHVPNESVGCSISVGNTVRVQTKHETPLC